MKKNILIIVGLIMLLGINVINADFSNDRDLLSLQKVAFAQDENTGVWDCYTYLIGSAGDRVLECNVPCCYRDHYKPSDNHGGHCTGALDICQY